MNFLNFILLGIPGLLMRQNRMLKKANKQSLAEQKKIVRLLQGKPATEMEEFQQFAMRCRARRIARHRAHPTAYAIQCLVLALIVLATLAWFIALLHNILT